MSDSLEQLLNLALDGREQRRHQHTVEQAQREPAIRAGRKEFEQRQTKFSTEVRSLMQTAAEQANEHLATRSEGCRVCEVSGYFTGPWFPGGSACNPIAYEVRVKGQVLGEALVLELTQDGMVEGHLAPVGPSGSQQQHYRLWHPIPLYQFDAKAASDILVRYMTATTMRWQFD
jgi:hypothetical protein